MSDNFEKACQLLRQITDPVELRQLNALAHERYVTQGRMNAYRLGEGAKVQFMSKQFGLVTGTVWKINKKTVKIRTSRGDQWTVSPGMLKAAE